MSLGETFVQLNGWLGDISIEEVPLDPALLQSLNVQHSEIAQKSPAHSISEKLLFWIGDGVP
jgi:hypothetical protein